MPNGFKPMAPYGGDVRSFAVSGRNLFAGTYGGGVFLSTNNGTSWTTVNTGLTNTSVRALAVSPNGAGGANLFAGTYSGAFLSTDNGTTWTAFNTGLPNPHVSSLALNDTYIYAGIFGGLWRRPSSETVVSVPPSPRNVPVQFSLEQNFPNPFNPTTNIKYNLPVNSFVVLKIYDVLGREVETLIHERQFAGSRSVTFNAKELPSGVYLYRLQAGSYTQTKKLILLR